MKQSNTSKHMHHLFPAGAVAALLMLASLTACNWEETRTAEVLKALPRVVSMEYKIGPASTVPGEAAAAEASHNQSVNNHN